MNNRAADDISTIGSTILSEIISYLEFPLVLNQIPFVNKFFNNCVISSSITWQNWKLSLNQKFVKSNFIIN